MIPIGVFNQPPENFAAWKVRGCTFVTGPDAGTAARMTSQAFALAADLAGLQVAGNYTARYPNQIAWYVPIDEPNEHATPIATVRAYVERFTAIDTTFPKALPILISIGGDKITSGDKPDYYQQLAALSPNIVFVVDWYCANRNPTTYIKTPQFPLGLNGEAVKKLIGWTGRKVWSFIECSWQRLDTQPLGREPIGYEMEMQVNQSIQGGAEGIVYFATATGSRNTIIDPVTGAVTPAAPIGWPARYDPPVNAAIPARQKAIAARLNPAAPIPAPPVTSPEVLRLQADVAELKANQAKSDAALEAQGAKIRAAADALR